jgi:starch synthase
LPEADFTPDKFEYYNNINILKGGIHYADMVNTVSHGYAAETKTQEGGYGLDYFLNLKGDNYLGILNGVDNSQWNPATDTLIPSNFDNNKLDGKYLCKKVLQEKLGLNPLANTPVIGIVSRFVKQKGLHLLSECIEDIVFNMEVQFAILGNGDKQLEAFFGSLPQKYPGKIGVFIGYSNELAHLIEAGSDFFLMPSIFEPCGLNQIYSLKYGTLPIVSATGGLDDTVENYNEKTGEGTGFKFWQVNSQSIYFTVGWAVSTYYDRKPHMNNLIQNAMSKVFSWENSTLQYVALYNRAIDNKKAIP